MAETLLETLLVQVRTDTRQASQGLETMRRDIDLLGVGADSVSRRMETAFDRFVRTGKFNFQSLRQLATGVLADIASAGLRSGINGLLGSLGGGSGSSGLVSGLLGILGLPGRSTGGTVNARTPYLVGERGPELFVPQNAGRIEARGSSGRTISITVNMSASGQDQRLMTRSANQVALAVQRSLARAERLA
jgi:Lambda phage tail tape-measure protein (Tape_meas_lam_C)